MLGLDVIIGVFFQAVDRADHLSLLPIRAWFLVAHEVVGQVVVETFESAFHLLVLRGVLTVDPNELKSDRRLSVSHSIHLGVVVREILNDQRLVVMISLEEGPYFCRTEQDD